MILFIINDKICHKFSENCQKWA